VLGSNACVVVTPLPARAEVRCISASRAFAVQYAAPEPLSVIFWR
jgi:hypothetical protein